MRTEVYSWRLTPDRKSALAAVARRKGTTISHLLEEVTDGLLIARDSEGDEADQARRQAEARKYFGIMKGDGTSATNARVREVARQRILERWKRNGAR